MKRRLIRIALGGLLLLALAGCNPLFQTRPPSRPPVIVLRACPDRPPPITVTAPIPAAAIPAHTIYLGSSGNLYALDALSSKTLWCQQVAIEGEFPCPGSCPPPPFMMFGQPAVAHGAVYACASGYGGYTYAFRASDGKLLWQVKSDCMYSDMPFRDDAIPLVGDGVVYNGPHALRASNGHILWTTTAGSGYVAFQALAGGVLYGNDVEHIVAVNVSTGSLRWTYTAPTREPPGDRLIVADHRVYFGTLDPGSAMYALDASSGSLLWKSTTPAYGDAALLGNALYFGSANNSVYAVRANTGATLWRWQNPSSAPTNTEVTGANGMLYVSMDAVYALDAATGALRWRQPLDEPLGAHQNVWLTPATVAGNVVYLARTDGYGNSVLFALNAATGAIYWHVSPLSQVTPVVVA